MCLLVLGFSCYYQTSILKQQQPPLSHWLVPTFLQRICFATSPSFCSSRSCIPILCDFQICRKYPPAPVFLRQMLKLLILAAESDGEEVLESLYELHAAYLLTQQVTILFLLSAATHLWSSGSFNPPAFLLNEPVSCSPLKIHLSSSTSMSALLWNLFCGLREILWILFCFSPSGLNF